MGARRRIRVADKAAADKAMSRDEIAAVTAALMGIAEEAEDVEGRTAGRPRDPDLYRQVALLWRLGATCGARISELLDIAPAEVRKSGPRHVRTFITRKKGGKSVWVKIGNGVAAELLDHARAAGRDGCDHVFTTSTGARLSHQQVSRCIALAVKRAKVRMRGRMVFHALRAHVAVREWERTRDLRRVQSVLGHSNAASTYSYLALDLAERERHIAEALDGLDY